VKALPIGAFIGSLAHMMQSPTALSADEAFGITEERKSQWCLLAVSGHGHPTYMCMACQGLKVTVIARNAALPKACGNCKKALKAPIVTSFEARALMTRSGHQNLIDGERDCQK
jgi:hypothetical protein